MRSGLGTCVEHNSDLVYNRVDNIFFFGILINDVIQYSRRLLHDSASVMERFFSDTMYMWKSWWVSLIIHVKRTRVIKTQEKDFNSVKKNVFHHNYIFYIDIIQRPCYVQTNHLFMLKLL